MKFPHNLRNIYRIVVVITIIICFTMLTVRVGNMHLQEKIQGTKTKSNSNRSSTNQYLISAIEHKNNYQNRADKKEFDAARDSILASLEADSKNPFAIRLLQELNTQDINQTEEEIQKIIKILEVRPDYAAAWISLGILYEQIDEVDLAKYAKEKAKALNSNL
ncbi:MAG: hypothetical protein ACD_57C00011G0002 [uncultured bacterium]|nr:MAG: hypothetical protein ACD_57C00011G0002 [uncultured bacterium]